LKRLLIFSLFIVALLSWKQIIHAAEPAAATPVRMKWLGTAGWEIQVGSTTILIDPFITRHEAAPTVEWKTDEAEVLRVLNKADFIFAGHSHADHIADIPFIAKRFGAKVIGSGTTTNIAITAGVDKAQVITIAGGEKLEFKDFTVQVVNSVHGTVTRGGQQRQPRTAEILQPLNGPITGRAFVEGGSYLYYFTLGNHRVLHQSTGSFIEANLKGLQPEVAILAENRNYQWSEAIKILQPKTVIIHHYDDWRSALALGIPDANLRRAQRFERDIKSINPQIKVIIPEHLQQITLE
jgi:L-ascorbate metabolism protein UlaG (beta-lactamase superfamily)